MTACGEEFSSASSANEGKYLIGTPPVVLQWAPYGFSDSSSKSCCSALQPMQQMQAQALFKAPLGARSSRLGAWHLAWRHHRACCGHTTRARDEDWVTSGECWAGLGLVSSPVYGRLFTIQSVTQQSKKRAREGMHICRVARGPVRSGFEVLKSVVGLFCSSSSRSGL